MTTPILELDEWEANQSQPNITVNEALRWLELFACDGPILDRDLTEPPATPSEGDAYIPADGATGDWAGHENEIALFIGTAWSFRAAPQGKMMWVVDEETFVQYVLSSPPGWVVPT